MAEKEKDMINEEELTEAPAPEEETAGSSQGTAPECSEEEKLRRQLEETNDRYLRLMAEYDNYRKRSTKEKEDIYPHATAAAVEKFLPIMDNLDRARQFDPGTEEFAKGFEMICQSLADVFKSFGVEEVGETGEPFDPNKHNAVMHIEDPELGENVVSQVLQKGYRIGERIIRYAMVQTAN